MSQQDRPQAEGGSSGHLPYVHGSGATEQRRLERRTAAAAAAFFLPHLRPGMRLLDCGCGVGSITLGLAAAVAPAAVVGIDLQPAQIERARALAAERRRPERPLRGRVGLRAAAAGRLGRGRLRPHAAVAPAGAGAGAAGDAPRAHARGRGGHRRRRSWARSSAIPSGRCITEMYRLFWKVIRAPRRRPLLRAPGARASSSKPASPARSPRPRSRRSGPSGTLEETREFAAWLVDQLRQPAFVALVTARGWADEAALDAMAAELLAWGERPDAYQRRWGSRRWAGWMADRRLTNEGPRVPVGRVRQTVRPRIPDRSPAGRLAAPRPGRSAGDACGARPAAGQGGRGA